MDNTKTDVKIYLIKYTGNHPIATITPNRVFEIIKMGCTSDKITSDPTVVAT